MKSWFDSMNDTVWFEFYGPLEHVDRRKYLKSRDFSYVGTLEGDDGCLHDIVRDNSIDKEYYTEI